MDANQKECPSCKQVIQADASFCAYCGTRFSVVYTGYCTTCHAVRELNAQDRCISCGSVVIDRHVESRYQGDASVPPAVPNRMPAEIASGKGTPPVGGAPAQKKAGAKGCGGCLLAGVRVFAVLILVATGILLFSPDAREAVTRFLRGSGVEEYLEEKIPTANALVSEEEIPTEPLVSPTPRNTATPRPSPTPDIDLPALGPNALCYGNYSYGINCLDDSGWISEGFLKLTYTSVTDFALCQDSLLLFDSGSILAYDGSRWGEYTPGGSTFSRIGCGAKGHIWSVDSNGARLFDGTTWTEYLYENVFPGKSFYTVHAIAVDPRDELWIALDGSILHRVGDQWTLFEKDNALKEDYSLNGIALDSKGNPWASHTGGLVTYDGSAWQEINAPASVDIHTLLIDPTDRVWVGTETGVSSYEKGQWQHYPVGNQGGSVESLALDEQGRLWAGTDWGLGVLENRAWTFFHMADSGMTMNSIGPLAVRRNGPPLPLLEEKAPGGLSGTLLNAGNPLVGARVEVCVKPLGIFFSGATPCTGQPFLAKTQTDASGQFSFDDLPPAFYSVTFQTPDGKWKVYSQTLTIGSKQVKVVSGKTTETEPMDIAK